MTVLIYFEHDKHDQFDLLQSLVMNMISCCIIVVQLTNANSKRHRKYELKVILFKQYLF